jgi:hypothetical protein
VTWRHPRTKALLIRGAGYHGKSVMGMLKAHPTSAGNLKGIYPNLPNTCTYIFLHDFLNNFTIENI